jgi:ectoine hydroxylase
MLQQLFARYTGFLRNLKAVYVINNWLQRRRLQHNKALYRQAGLSKSIFSPIGHSDFKTAAAPDALPWIDQPDALTQLAYRAGFGEFSPEIQEKIRQFISEGYLVLEGSVSSDEIAALNRETDLLLQSGQTGFNYTGRKIPNMFEQSQLADERFFRRPELLQLLGFLLGREVVPFQSLNFMLGSEQRPHSDAIHMTTEPQGYMIAAWYALEPCTPHNGPLVYFSGSHRLPFVTTHDYDSGNTRYTIGANSNRRYEDKIADVIAQTGLQPRYFMAQTGDILIWHSNLIHGGSPITATEPVTRRSMVCHYFGKNVICYHEMSQRPALLKQ